MQRRLFDTPSPTLIRPACLALLFLLALPTPQVFPAEAAAPATSAAPAAQTAATPATPAPTPQAAAEEPPPRPPATPLEARLRQLAAGQGQARQANGEPVLALHQITELYGKNGFKPLWTDRNKIADLKKAVLASADEGLTPGDYHLAAIQRALGEAGTQAAATAGSDAALDQDILLTDALMLLGEHLLHGKADRLEVREKAGVFPKAPELDVDFYQQALTRGRIAEAMRERVPTSPHYQALKRALIASRGANEEAAAALTRIPAGPPIKFGNRGERVAALKKRLVESGELRSIDVTDDVYDEALLKAVKKFQAAHGLMADGVVGGRSQAVLNGDNTPTPAKRVQQIRANMERSRWLMRDLPNRALVVDIPTYTLRYYQDGKEAWTTRVIVGRPGSQTPSFRSKIDTVVVNPTWTVPPGMLRKEYLPRLMRNPGAVGSLRVYDSSGRQVNPGSVNWSRCLSGGCPYALRQAPGARNSLGQVKFTFPNPHAVYLHDTPAKGLFGAQTRALSHGCVRVQSPKELAYKILEGDTGNPITPKGFDRLLATGKNGGIALKNPLPVILFYATVKDGGNGKLIYSPDIYNRDGAIIAALDRPPRPLAAPRKPDEEAQAAAKAKAATPAAPATDAAASAAKPAAPDKTATAAAAPVTQPVAQVAPQARTSAAAPAAKTAAPTKPAPGATTAASGSAAPSAPPTAVAAAAPSGSAADAEAVAAAARAKAAEEARKARAARIAKARAEAAKKAKAEAERKARAQARALAKAKAKAAKAAREARARAQAQARAQAEAAAQAALPQGLARPLQVRPAAVTRQRVEAAAPPVRVSTPN